MSKANTSSIDTNNGEKLAYYASQQKSTNNKFQSKKSDVSEQVINAKKAQNLATAKAKAKKKAKLAKASRKKNKKRG